MLFNIAKLNNAVNASLSRNTKPNNLGRNVLIKYVRGNVIGRFYLNLSVISRIAWRCYYSKVFFSFFRQLFANKVWYRKLTPRAFGVLSKVGKLGTTSPRSTLPS